METNLKNLNQGSMQMLLIAVNNSISLREQIADYDNTADEIHVALEKKLNANLNQIIMFLRKVNINLVSKEKSVWTKYDLLCRLFPVIQEQKKSA